MTGGSVGILYGFRRLLPLARYRAEASAFDIFPSKVTAEPLALK
jgi:hypothetical protein